MKRKSKLFGGLLLILLSVVILSYSFNINVNAEKLDVDPILKSIVNFNNKSPKDIVKVGEKVLKNGNGKIIDMFDGDYYYNVNSNGDIQTIVRKHNDTLKLGEKISKEKAKEKADILFKKLNRINMNNYDVTINERDYENNQAYSIMYQEKISDDVYTGSFIYLDILPNGEFQNAVVKVEDKKDYVITVSKYEAKDLVVRYMSNHQILKNYVSSLSDNNFKIIQTVFNGYPIWDIKVIINGQLDKPLRYLIDVSTGKMLLKFEPPTEGFTLDEDQIQFAKSIEESY